MASFHGWLETPYRSPMETRLETVDEKTSRQGTTQLRMQICSRVERNSPKAHFLPCLVSSRSFLVSHSPKSWQALHFGMENHVSGLRNGKSSSAEESAYWFLQSCQGPWSTPRCIFDLRLLETFFPTHPQALALCLFWVVRSLTVRDYERLIPWF